MNLPKLAIVANESVCWDGDQIGDFDPELGIVELDVSEENFENCEIPKAKRQEIRENLPAIKEELVRRGYHVEIDE